jgi:hypothetical protein
MHVHVSRLIPVEAKRCEMRDDVDILDNRILDVLYALFKYIKERAMATRMYNRYCAVLFYEQMNVFVYLLESSVIRLSITSMHSYYIHIRSLHSYGPSTPAIRTSESRIH